MLLGGAVLNVPLSSCFSLRMIKRCSFQCMENISLIRTDGETSDLILTETVVFIRSYHHRWVVICLLFTLEALPRLHLCSLECVIEWIIRKKCFGAVLCW